MGVGATWAFLGTAPTPLILDFLCAALILSAVILTLRRTAPTGLRILTSVAAIILVLIAVAIELPHAFQKPIPRVNSRRMYVIGDSLSSWVADGGERSWPRIVTSEHGVELIDLAVGGATTESQLQNIRNIQFETGLVVLEIGGNDMFTHRPLQDFEADLEKLAIKAAAPGSVLVTFELPHYPLNQGYAAVQRRVAVRHNIIMIPRRSLSDVLVQPGATIADGFHLTQAGHQIMAEKVWNILGSSFAQ